MVCVVFFFFFQAEDGIRDKLVTGVQTCALPIWFGIIIIILMELAMITPPVGINLYVVQGLRKRGKIDDVIIGASPFVITMLLMIVVLSVWPRLALWLPSMAGN